ncbi:hypothetical protein GOP47_0022299 [Adiantum capillus-veneris]|uniref:Mitochondrial inner membrane protease ATP23 n=1 Tax=Adiantum capillus-veneris TaxID=13818 RepID=A0A9D4U8G5_ADICA|nr:hypothetical protein GOP47_0021950 [Adiantum capillus-veneris]KAI5063752.1 hypothetical protein GOP47_0022299 [Adiantum capillus-veneris]
MEEAVKSLYGTTVEHCEEMIDHSLAQNIKVKFLLESHEKAGCPIVRKFFKAVNCGEGMAAAGGYQEKKGITVCSNRIILQDEVDQTLIHELIHSYDQCRAKNVDWTNCAHHACSEIRAGNLSGDCHFKRELLRGYFEICKHHQSCVRRRVMKSLALNPYCPKSALEKERVMDEVWDICYKDTKPFDRVP